MPVNACPADGEDHQSPPEGNSQDTSKSSSRLEMIKARLAKADKRIASERCRILDEGEYTFKVVESRLEHDSERKYGYLYVNLLCNESILTSDRFPDSPNMLWKFAAFLASIGIDLDRWESEKELIGLTGRLVASSKGSLRIYTYQPVTG